MEYIKANAELEQARFWKACQIANLVEDTASKFGLKEGDTDRTAEVVANKIRHMCGVFSNNYRKLHGMKLKHYEKRKVLS